MTKKKQRKAEPVDVSAYLSRTKQVWLYTYVYATDQGIALCDDCAATTKHKQTLIRLSGSRVSLCNQCGYTDPETDMEDD